MMMGYDGYLKKRGGVNKAKMKERICVYMGAFIFLKKFLLRNRK